jgi:hypothetical protein
MEGSTVRAAPLANSQRYFSRTVPLAEQPLLDGNQRSAITTRPPRRSALYSPLRSELEKTHIGNGPGQVGVLQHPAHVQALDDDGVKSSRDLRRELVPGVPPDTCDTGMNPGQPGSRLFRVLRQIQDRSSSPHDPRKGSRPVNISQYMRQSLAKLQNGAPNVAGRLCSKA